MGELIHESARTIAELTQSLVDELVQMRDAPVDIIPDRDALQVRCDLKRSQMRAEIQSYVRSLRADGVPPERAIVLLKGALQVGLRGGRSDESVADALLHDGVEWCINAYYTD